MHASGQRPPVAVGGTGGSGTRLVAQILQEVGYYIGDDLNPANDNLWFTLLFKRREVVTASDDEMERLTRIFVKGMTRQTGFSEPETGLINTLAATDRDLHSSVWLRQRADSLLSAVHRPVSSNLWGWKEPNTHIVMDRLPKLLPDMKYVHVVRNGLDMAFSRNQNQLRLWGPLFLGSGYHESPYHSLKFWRRAHERVLFLGARMGARFLFLNYDRLCLDPAGGIRRLLEFLEVNASEAQARHLTGLVGMRDSIGRFKQYGTQLFDPDDVAFVRQLGFDTGP